MVLSQSAPSRLYKTVSVTTPLFNLFIPAVPATFTFQPIPMGSVWTGTIQVLQAPAWAFHQCTIGGVLWAEWLGFQPSPVIQAMTGEVITVTSSGLSPNTLYQATLIGRSDPSDTYIPVWPEAAQNTSLGSNNITETAFGSLANPLTTTTNQLVATGLPGTVLAIQVFSAGGTCTGLRIQVNTGIAGRITTMYPQNNALLQPWFFCPVQDSTATITIDPILNKAIGGSYAIVLRTCILTYPALTIPILQSGYDNGIASNNDAIGQTVEVLCTNAATTTILPEPPTGSMYLIRNMLFWNSTAVTAGCSLVPQGTFSAVAYSRVFFTAATTGQTIPLPSPNPFLLGDAIRADPAEGLQVVSNNASGNVRAIVNFDVIPFPQPGNILNT